eukprot:scaffold240579_cov47-Prasinocladus_malaysianus.AAC.1
MLRDGSELFARKFFFNDPVVERIRDELVFGELGLDRQLQLQYNLQTTLPAPDYKFANVH